MSNIKYYKINEKLSHLKESELNSLIERYYAGEKVTTLLKEYSISSTSASLANLFPWIIHENLYCVYCKKQMVSRLFSRTSEFNRAQVFCPDCLHSNSKNCHCTECIQNRKRSELMEQERKRAMITYVYSVKEENELDLNSLTLREKVFYGALLRSGLNEDYSKIKPLKDQTAKLSPLKEFDIEILRDLHSKRIILVHPDSNIEAFSKEEAIFPYQFDLTEVNYYPISGFGIDRKDFLDRIQNPNLGDISQFAREDLLELWVEIALQECLEYLQFSMKKVNFSHVAGTKTILIFKDLLKVFSTSQIFAIINRSIANASKYYLERSLNKKHAANVVVSNCQLFGERALANGWIINGFKRDFNCEQSILSKFFYDRVIRLGDEGFTKCPSNLLLCSILKTDVNS